MAESVHELYDADAIAARVRALAAEVEAAFGADFVLLCVLNGAFMFAADLARALTLAGPRPRVEFATFKSYGTGMESSGKVHLMGELPDGLAGARVLLVDDILDSGRTLLTAKMMVEDAGAAEVRTCVLLDKPERRAAPIEADHVGFRIDDLFVVGYGIDYAEKYRCLPYLAYVETT